MHRFYEFFESRGKPAEEATCHLSIHATLQQAVQAHACLWFSVPFLPWTTYSLDGINLNGEGAAAGSVQLGQDFDDLEDSINKYDSEVKEEFRGIRLRFDRFFVVTGRHMGTGIPFYGVANLYNYEIINCPVS